MIQNLYSLARLLFLRQIKNWLTFSCYLIKNHSDVNQPTCISAVSAHVQCVVAAAVSN